MQKFWPLIVLVLVALVTLGALVSQPGKKPESAAPVEELEIVDLKEGDGAEAKAGDQVEMHYTGTLKSNGSQFDSSVGKKPFIFTIGRGEVIQGWDKGIPGMKEGGKRKLVIPAKLAYGAQSPSPDIPPNSDLVFEVQLLRVLK